MFFADVFSLIKLCPAVRAFCNMVGAGIGTGEHLIGSPFPVTSMELLRMSSKRFFKLSYLFRFGKCPESVYNSFRLACSQKREQQPAEKEFSHVLAILG